jgi:hypothetical protein
MEGDAEKAAQAFGDGNIPTGLGDVVSVDEQVQKSLWNPWRVLGFRGEWKRLFQFGKRLLAGQPKSCGAVAVKALARKDMVATVPAVRGSAAGGRRYHS